MTYNNRMLTTPTYINSVPSAFWSVIANDISHKLGESCKHSNYLNKIVACVSHHDNFRCIVTCNKCDFVFYSTGKALSNMIGHFGF